MKTMQLWKLGNLWELWNYEIMKTVKLWSIEKHLKAKLWNYEIMKRRKTPKGKTMKLWQLWNYKIMKIMKTVKLWKLWNYENYETMQYWKNVQAKLWNCEGMRNRKTPGGETMKIMKLWNHANYSQFFQKTTTEIKLLVKKEAIQMVLLLVQECPTDDRFGAVFGKSEMLLQLKEHRIKNRKDMCRNL